MSVVSSTTSLGIVTPTEITPWRRLAQRWQRRTCDGSAWFDHGLEIRWISKGPALHGPIVGGQSLDHRVMRDECKRARCSTREIEVRSTEEYRGARDAIRTALSKGEEFVWVMRKPFGLT